jgi:hypothetical protein|tara:strand:- start:1210 stop:1329 length:120 start_codon:yes stop_codon:yes gene_type:complete
LLRLAVPECEAVAVTGDRVIKRFTTSNNIRKLFMEHSGY